jgi:hypothetical protein
MYRPRSDGIFPPMWQIPIRFCVVVALVAVFLLVGCAAGGGASQGQGGQEGHTTHHQSAIIKLHLHPEHNSGVSGTAFFRHTSDGVVVKLELRNLPKPNTLYLAHIHPGTCAAEGKTHEHGGTHGGKPGHGSEGGHGNEHGWGSHEHGGANHEHGGAGAEIEYPLSQVKSDSQGHGSSTTTLGETSVDKLFSGDPKYVNVHEAGSGNPPILACADLKRVE